MSKVSVVVPVYNVEDYLEKCLDSLIHQTLEEIEILCVDDGSTDHSNRTALHLSGAVIRGSVLKPARRIVRCATMCISTHSYVMFVPVPMVFRRTAGAWRSGV